MSIDQLLEQIRDILPYKQSFEIEKGYITSVKERKIFYRLFYTSPSLPDLNKISRILIHVHGMTSHSKPSILFSDCILSPEMLFISFDLSGHGKSEGIRGKIPRFRDFLDNLSSMIFTASKRFPNRDLILSGESMGALVVALYCILNYPKEKDKISLNLKSLLLFSPAFSPNLTSGWARDWKFIIEFGINFLLNHENPVIPVDHSKTFRDPLTKTYHDKDPLVYKHYSPQYIFKIKEAMDRLWRYGGPEPITIPFLIMRGTHDNLVDVSAMDRFYHQSPIKDQSYLHIIPGAWHYLFTDPSMSIPDWDLIRAFIRR